MRRRPLVTILALLTLSVALAGCTEQIRSYERAPGAGDEFFTFDVAEGTRRLIIDIDAEQATAGTMEIIIATGGGVAYMGTLAAGSKDRAIVDQPTPGLYAAMIDYKDFEGGATIAVSAASGGTTLGPVNDFWSILGFFLTLTVAVGGWILYRRHTKRLDREMARIDETFTRLHNDIGSCRRELLDVREDLRRRLVASRLKESHFMILERRIENYLHDLERGVGLREGETALAFE